jgi:hypothetical protein
MTIKNASFKDQHEILGEFIDIKTNQKYPYKIPYTINRDGRVEESLWSYIHVRNAVN